MLKVEGTEKPHFENSVGQMSGKMAKRKSQPIKNQSVNSSKGAGEGTRTHTREAPDPKSGLSTNFNTPAVVPFQGDGGRAPVTYPLVETECKYRKNLQLEVLAQTFDLGGFAEQFEEYVR